MEHDPRPLDPDATGRDTVAESRSLQRAAEEVLASGALDDDTAREIRSACEQLTADRADGENPDDSIRRLRDLLARSSEG